MRRQLSGQGATEYLVLLAVVLIIALVGIALLGFFPGAASDAQISESQIYWQSQTPLAITEWAAKVRSGDANTTLPYLRLRNTGQYPIRLTGLLGTNGYLNRMIWPGTGSWDTLSNLYYLGPGEEKYIAAIEAYAVPAERFQGFRLPTDTRDANYFNGADTLCSGTSAAGTGNLVVRSFGFEYVAYIEGQQITKREIGSKPLAIKCS